MTTAVFVCSLGLQTAGLQPAVPPCCAAKVRQTKQETMLTEKKKKIKRTEAEPKIDA